MNHPDEVMSLVHCEQFCLLLFKHWLQNIPNFLMKWQLTHANIEHFLNFYEIHTKLVHLLC